MESELEKLSNYIYKFPKYPFIWDYNDMYNLSDYVIEEYDITSDTNIIELLKIYEKHKVVKTKQIINRENIKNINIHTWYLSEDQIIDSDDYNIHILLNKNLNYKKNVFGFIFDPNNIFEISSDILHRNYEIKRNCDKNILIIKNINNIKKDMKTSNYIHVHYIKNIFRFSPGNNNIIKIKDNVKNSIFYTILDKIIVVNEICII
jgi:hypothetical protein